MNKQHNISLYYKTGFSAAHRYYKETISKSENNKKYGKCAQIHGHNFSITLGLYGQVNSQTGMLIDFNEIENIVEKNINSKFDYSYINKDVEFFKHSLPTMENLSVYIFQILQTEFPKHISLISVNVAEDDTLSAEFRKD